MMRLTLASSLAIPLLLAGCGTQTLHDPLRPPDQPAPPAVDVSGRWVGYHMQLDTYPYTYPYYAVLVELTQKGAQVSGTIWRSNAPATFELTGALDGLVSGRDVFIETTHFTTPCENCCLISAMLSHKKDEMGERLSGEFARGTRPGACPAHAHGHYILEPVREAIVSGDPS